MSGVKEAALTVCLALMITAVVRYLAPNGLTQEMLRMVSGFLVLVTLVGTVHLFAGVMLQWQWEAIDIDTTLAETTQRQRMGAAEGALYDYICGLLQAAGADYDEVHIFLRMTDNPTEDGIVLDRIRVEAEHAVQRERIRGVLVQFFPGVTIEVDETDE